MKNPHPRKKRPEQINRAPLKGLEKLQPDDSGDPDLLVEIGEVIRSEKFLEGVHLFNKGYHWEAHEAWEDVWRDQEGDAKAYVQAFLQMADAYSFLKLSKAGSAKYLLEKAVEKLLEFEHLDSGMPLTPLIDSMRSALRAMASSAGNGGPHPNGAAPPVISLPKS